MQTYTSTNTVEAFQITEQIFEDATKANEAQKLPLNEVHYAVEQRFCTLNCINKTLNFQGITLNIGDYLIKSGNTLEPCSKEKFEEEFCHVKDLGDNVVFKSELEKTIEIVEEMVKENPETANFVDKVSDIVKSLFVKPQENTETQYSVEYIDELKEKADKYDAILPERPLETQEDFAEEILALMKKINLKSVTRDISGEVPENTFDYFETTDEIKD